MDKLNMLAELLTALNEELEQEELTESEEELLDLFKKSFCYDEDEEDEEDGV